MICRQLLCASASTGLLLHALAAPAAGGLWGGLRHVPTRGGRSFLLAAHLHGGDRILPMGQSRPWGEMVVVVKTVLGSHFGVLVNSPPILEPILVGIGMFIGISGFDPWPNQLANGPQLWLRFHFLR